MTSGSCRSAARSAAAKLTVSMPISRWLMLAIWSLWMNSIGSSTVTMWSGRVAFRCPIMLAIEVLLPLPAAPTTSTIPFCFSQSSRETGIGSSRSSIGGMSVGMKRMTTASEPRCRYTFTRKRPMPAAKYDVSCSLRSSMRSSTSGLVITCRATASESSAVILSVRK